MLRSILTALKAWLVCKLVGNLFWIGGAAASVVLILELRLVCLPFFSIVDRFRDVSVRTADIETLGAIYIHRDVPVILGVPIYSKTRQRDEAAFLRCHPLDGLVVASSSSVGLPEGKSSYCWIRWKFLLHTCYIQMSYWIWRGIGFW